MKNLFFLSIYILVANYALAQAPNKFRYQAVARDASGAVITDNINIRISFLEDSPNGLNKYAESHLVTPNPQGVFDLTIGEGTPETGDMDFIVYAKHEYFLKIEMKKPEDAGYTEMGITQLLSVPYAMYAAKAGNELTAGQGIDIVNHSISALDDSPTNEIQVLSLDGDELSLSNGGGSIQLPTSGANSWNVIGDVISNSPMSSSVSIGSADNQDSKLYVVAGGTETGGLFYNTGTGNALVGYNSNTGAGVFGTSNSGRGGQFTSIHGPGGYFNSVNGPALITDIGNVGIGVLDPVRKLHVSGSTLLTNSQPNGIALEIGAGKVGIGITAPTHKFEVNGASYFENFAGPSLVTGQGNVGIGINNPTSKLTVVGGSVDGIFTTSDTKSGLICHSYGANEAAYFHAVSAPAGVFYSEGDFGLFVQQGGAGSSGIDVGIQLKHASANWKTYIDAQNDFNFAYNNTLRAWIYDTDGSYHNNSDRSLKKNIQTFSNVLPKLKTLQAYTYQMKNAPDDSPISVGFMAQDVEEQFPQLVVEKEGYKSLCYDHFAVLSVQAINEQQVEIEELKSKIERLEQLVMTLTQANKE